LHNRTGFIRHCNGIHPILLKSLPFAFEIFIRYY
jgi:hypothetical protein